MSGRFLPDNCIDSDPLKELELWFARDDYVSLVGGNEPSGSEPSASLSVPTELRCQKEDKVAIRSLLLHALRVAAHLDPGTGTALSSRSIVTLPNVSSSSSSEDLTIGLAQGYSVGRDDKGVPIYTNEYDKVGNPKFSTDPDSYTRPLVTSENPVMKVVLVTSENPVMKVVDLEQIKKAEAEEQSSSEAFPSALEVPRLGPKSSSSRGAFAVKSYKPLVNPGAPSGDHDSDDPQSLLADGVTNMTEVEGQPQPRIQAKHASVRPPVPLVKAGRSVPNSSSGSTSSALDWWSPEQRPAPSVPERAAAFGLQQCWRPSVPVRATAVPSGAPPPSGTGRGTGKGSWKGQWKW